MKASFYIKIFFVLPLLLFADYVLMALIGCTTCLFELGDNFYCGPFCLAGKIILALTTVFFGYLIFPEIRGVFKSKSYGTSTDKQKN